MSAVERMTVTVPAEMASMLKTEVAKGDYASASEIVREALRDWEVKKEWRRRKLEALRGDIQQGIDSGPSVPADQVFDELLRRYGAAPRGEG